MFFVKMAPVKVIVVGVTVVLVLLSLVEEGNLKKYFHSDNSMDCVIVQSCWLSSGSIPTVLYSQGWLAHLLQY